MKKTINPIASVTLAMIIFGILVFIIYGIILLISNLVEKFFSLDPRLTISIISAVGTILVATLTVVLGRFYERKKEIESHFRERKIEIYDSFLKELFKLFLEENDNEELVKFLREWHRKMVLWGGNDVLNKYLEWNNHLKTYQPNAQTAFLMEELFKEIRSDIGLSNRHLGKGSFIRLLLRDPELFLKLAKENPNITFEEVAEVEKSRIR